MSAAYQSQSLPGPFNNSECASVPVAAIILAAGKSTRMRSKLPKPLHPICGLPMTSHVIRACKAAGVIRIVVVVGHEAEAVQVGLGDEVEYALQTNQRGTGDAVNAARPLLHNWPGTILVLAGDVPLISDGTLRTLIEHHRNTESHVTLLTAYLDDPTGYGRVVRDGSGHVTRIVEHRDATEAERAIKEWNPSLYAFDSASLWSALDDVRPSNVQGEYYLTDTLGILSDRSNRIEAISTQNSDEALGVNNRVELSQAATKLRRRLLEQHMLNGVSMTDPASTYIDADVIIGQDTTIEPNCYLKAGTVIGEDCIIGPMTRIERSIIGNKSRILASQVVGSELSDEVTVGPFSNLRAGTVLGTKVKIGDFVETKQAVFGERAQASHLSYIGDAEVGEGANIGAGTVTCNYNGYEKSRTIIGKNAFIGSNSTLIAPISIGDGAFIAAASPMTENVPDDAMGIARSLPTIKLEWAAKFHASKKCQKNQNE